MNLALLVAVHGRELVTSVCYDGIERLKSEFKANGIKLVTYVVCSTEDEVKRAKLRKFKAIRFDNRPLGRKMNALLQFALKDKWTYMMQLGSDDLMTRAGVDAIVSNIEAGRPFFGFDSVTVIEAKSLRCKSFSGDVVFGAGRCIRRDLVESVWNASGRMWSDSQNRAMDWNSQHSILRFTRVKPFKISLPKPAIIDIKSGSNINSFASFQVPEIPYERFAPELLWVEFWQKKNPDLFD